VPQLLSEMRKIPQYHAMVVFGAVLALAFAPVFTNFAFADSIDVDLRLQEIQNRLKILQEKTEEFKDSEIGKQAFQFRITGELLSEFKKPTTKNMIEFNAQVKTKLAELTESYSSIFEKYNKIATDFKNSNSDVSMQKKKLINQLKKNQLDYETFSKKIDEQTKTNQLMKTELKKIKLEKEFHKIHTKIYVKNDHDNGIPPDESLELTLNAIAESEQWSLLPVGMDKLIERYTEPEVKEMITEYKEVILNLIEQIEQNEDSQGEILTLSSNPDVENEYTSSEINQIVTSSIITAQFSQEIKETVSKTQNVIQQTKDQQSERKLASVEWAYQEEQNDKPVAETSEPAPEIEPEKVLTKKETKADKAKKEADKASKKADKAAKKA